MFTRLQLFAAGTFAALYHGEQVCDGPYVLCAAAPCTYLPGNSSFATCTCVGPYTGLNLGTSNDTCKSRTESLISTFSLRNPYAPPSQYETGSGNSVDSGSNGWGGYGGGGWNKGHGGGGGIPPVYAIPCVGSNAAPWTDCNGAPCTVGRNGAVTCTCPVQPASDNFYYGSECPKSDDGLTGLCKQLRSTADAPSFATRENMPSIIEAATLGPFYGDQNQISSCL
ncbi:hypothetical protein M409DRAFT_30008 [Zasmidium cellare ATCC 36951]|uniref:EGF-like domain-containing protein n=1 Tax=Zasmidium cellare ATCC 36951 TaxID=1080233 RepID=A0A6A6BY58_ZASCE|nr:uncharacterized protein M409DRAFT_30008 [Zasmidium cellare ATCC 36951]KAF2159533.1 hypothetical protein M409DRAFT_30008 [Zasmidium cellare ATCC 36951]